MTDHHHSHNDHASPKGCCSAHEAPKTQGVKDPVCGMTVDPHTAKHRHEYRGHTYYFCSAGCREKFIANPEKYLSDQPRKEDVYTCPMHPEIIRDHPSSCPLCGMALEPVMPALDEG